MVTFIQTWSCGESGGISQWLPCGTESHRNTSRRGRLWFHGMFTASRKPGVNFHSTFTHCLILFSAVSNRTQANHSFIHFHVYVKENCTPHCASNGFSLQDINGWFRKTGKPPDPVSGLTSNPPITSPVFQASLTELGKEWTDSTEAS